MVTTNSQFVIKRLDGFGGNFVDSQYLGAAYEEVGKPHLFQNTLMKIFSAQNRFFTSKPILAMTGAKSDGYLEIDTEVYRWYLYGAEEKCARVVENLESGNSTPGINHSIIRVKLDLNYYAEPDVLMPEDNRYPLEIVGEGVDDGTGTIYSLRLQGDDPTIFLPTNLLEEGKEFSKVWTTVSSEYNDVFGTQQVPSTFQLESQVGAFAQKFTVTDKALREQGKVGIGIPYKDPRTGKETIAKTFMSMYEAKMHDELYTSMEAQYIFGVRQTRPGNNQYWKKTGPGLREQLKDGWIDVYSGPLTVTRLTDYLLNIQFSRVEESDRNVVIMTGTLGLNRLAPSSRNTCRIISLIAGTSQVA